MTKSDKQPQPIGGKQKRKKEIEDTLSSIDLSTLKTCLSVYNKIKSAGPCYLNEFESDLGVDNATIHRRIARLEDAMSTLLRREQPKESNREQVKFQLFERQRGAKAKIPTDVWLKKEVESIFFNIQEIVNVWDRLAHRWGAGAVVVRIAATLSAARFIVPNLLRVPELKGVWFDVTQTKSSRLLEMARTGSRDLILTEVPRDFQKSNIAEVFQFKLAIIAPRGHVLEQDQKPLLKWGEFYDKLVESDSSLCLLNDDPSLYPLPDYPDPSSYPKKLPVLRVGSTTLCHSLVMNSRAGSSVVAITGTQFLTEDDLERLVIIDLPSQPKESKPIHMALFRPNKPESDKDPGFNESRTRAVTIAETAIQDMLDKASIAQDSRSDRKFWIYHTTRVNDQAIWAKGELRLRLRAPNNDSNNRSHVRILTGTHTMHDMQEGLSYIVRGRAVQNEGDSHVTYRARSVGGATEDSYVFSGFCPSFNDLNAGPIVGVWNGVFSRADRPKGEKSFIPGAGIAVITDEEDVDVRFLNKRAKEYMAKYNSETILEADQFQEAIVSEQQTRKVVAVSAIKNAKSNRPPK